MEFLFEKGPFRNPENRIFFENAFRESGKPYFVLETSFGNPKNRILFWKRLSGIPKTVFCFRNVFRESRNHIFLEGVFEFPKDEIF
jgi:hypothetical protein